MGLNIEQHHAVLKHAGGRVWLRTVGASRTWVNSRLLQVPRGTLTVCVLIQGRDTGPW